ncbi:MAG: LamG-like jellyroll fold domain-containing protein [Candidatus Cloacimonadaceae bacterium]|nr:LamG-like jellyroll fold domain-containing protein [Candidatus Cloacimonadaceae bacterium]
MEVNSNFTIVSFAKIIAGHPAATLVWLPSNPFDTGVAVDGNPGQNLRYKPTGGIFFSGGNMHFTVTTQGYHSVTVSVPFTPDGEWPHNRDPWHFFGLTYGGGVLRAYINGVLRGTATAPGNQNALTNTYGFTLGRKDIRVLGAGGTSEYMYMLGLMDQVGLYNRTLSAAEMYNFYTAVINPADILYIKD